MKYTNGELELLSLVAEGFTTNEIAEKLHRSRGTIKSRKSRITTKLDAANMTEAVYKSVHEIVEWRRANGFPDDSIDKTIGFTKLP